MKLLIMWDGTCDPSSITMSILGDFKKICWRQVSSICDPIIILHPKSMLLRFLYVRSISTPIIIDFGSNNLLAISREPPCWTPILT